MWYGKYQPLLERRQRKYIHSHPIFPPSVLSVWYCMLKSLMDVDWWRVGVPLPDWMCTEKKAAYCLKIKSFSNYNINFSHKYFHLWIIPSKNLGLECIRRHILKWRHLVTYNIHHYVTKATDPSLTSYILINPDFNFFPLLIINKKQALKVGDERLMKGWAERWGETGRGGTLTLWLVWRFILHTIRYSHLPDPPYSHPAGLPYSGSHMDHPDHLDFWTRKPCPYSVIISPKSGSSLTYRI